MFDDTDEGILELWAKLENKLVGCFDGKAGCYETDVESPTERREHVDGPPLVKSKDGIDTLGELWADWRNREKGYESRKTGRFVRDTIKIHLFPEISCSLSGLRHFSWDLWVGERSLCRVKNRAWGHEMLFLELHRPALSLIGRRDIGVQIHWPQGSAESLGRSVGFEQGIVWEEKGSPTPGTADVWHLELLYYIYKAWASYHSPIRIHRAGSKYLHGSTVLCDQWLQQETEVWPNKPRPPWEGISVKVHLCSVLSYDSYSEVYLCAYQGWAGTWGHLCGSFWFPPKLWWSRLWPSEVMEVAEEVSTTKLWWYTPGSPVDICTWSQQSAACCARRAPSSHSPPPEST